MDNAESFIISGPLRQIAYTLSKFIKQRLSINNILGAEESRLHMQLRIDIRKMSNSELVTRFAADMISDDIKYYTALQSLIYQPNIFIIYGILQNLPLRHFVTFPCDVQLLTVRPLTSAINQRLMVLYRAGIDCTSLINPTCLENELDFAVKKYMQFIGVTTVQKTLLNGIKKISEEMDYQKVKFYLKPTDFATYLIGFDKLPYQ
ncbi:Alpha-mannosidase 2x [Dirofilaria immitis]